MSKPEIQYFEDLKKGIIKKISEVINKKNINTIIDENLLFHIKDKTSVKFQKYYFKILHNFDYYFNTTNFFKEFKYYYSLQGIDNQYLELLENNKVEISDLLKKNKLSELYLKYFANAQITIKGKKVIKNLGSFFVKLIHTFNPEQYCVLDNPIKDYFGLKHESFFIAFIIISKAYKEWISKNRNLIQEIRNKILQIDPDNILSSDKMTDLKLMDLIFWQVTNIKN